MVYRAEHRTPNMARRQGPVVLKTLHPHLAKRQEFRTRFEEEANILAAIDHPGVVRFVDLIEDQQTVALVMAHVPGKGLEECMDGWSPADVVLLVERLAQTLDHMHGLPEPIIHRDLKPSNIRITPQGLPVLIDFGIARAGVSTLTRTSTAMGTPDYMAPEQELDAKRVDGRADIYALGVIAFHLLTGHLPWEEELSWSVLFQRKAQGEQDLTAAGVAQAVFEQALAPDPEDRFERACAFVAALRYALGVPSPEATRVQPPDAPAPALTAVRKDKPKAGIPKAVIAAVMVIGAVALLALAFMFLAGWWSARDSDHDGYVGIDHWGGDD